MRVAAFTQGIHIPSARFRVRQYIPALRDLGVDIDEFYSVFRSYPPVCRWCRPAWAAAVLGERLQHVVKSFRYDATLLQREFLSTFYTLEGFTKSPRVLDVDDATFLYRDGRFAKRLAQKASVVICGNSFLADWYGRWNSRVFIVPTAVDAVRYSPSPNCKRSGDVVAIGWIGTSGNYEYLYMIERALLNILNKHSNVELRILSDTPPKFTIIPPERIMFRRWSISNEVDFLKSLDIGLMPLKDNLWARGKCSYKMLQYMATGIPVVVSPVGMNREVLNQCECGFGAHENSEWFDALDVLVCNGGLRLKLGHSGRSCVLLNYSVDVLAPKIAGALRAA